MAQRLNQKHYDLDGAVVCITNGHKMCVQFIYTFRISKEIGKIVMVIELLLMSFHLSGLNIS